MADVVSNWYPPRHVDPNEPGLVAAYTFADGELAQFGRYINRASTGAVYDLTAIGTPKVGQGGGIYAINEDSRFQSGAAATTALSYDLLYETIAAPLASRVVGNNGAHRFLTHGAAGFHYISFDNAATNTQYAANIAGRGVVLISAHYESGNQYLLMNGRVMAGPTAVVPAAPAGDIRIGQHGTSYFLAFRSGRVLADVRRDALKFARRVLWQWQPRDCGEGPAGGILTGSYSGVGGWTCPLGAATMGFVQRGDRLCLTDTQAVNMNRIDFEFGSRPFFGTIILEYQIRDPATDSPIIGFTPRRGVDPQAAGSQSYWCWMRTAAGPWWRVSMGYENNTAVPIDSADAPWPGPNAGDRCIAVVSRDVDGSVQTWNYVPNPTKGWWWTTAVGNHVTTLAEGCITVAPRGSYIERISWLQGAATPHELGIRVP